MGFNASNLAWNIDLKQRFEDYGLEPSLATGVTRNILSFLAHVHNDIQGGPSYYSYSQMAKKCLVARKTAIQHCHYLEQIDLLKIVRKKTEDGKMNERNNFYLNFQVVIKSGNDTIETDYSNGGVVTSGNQGSNVRLLGVVTSGDPKKEDKQEVNKNNKVSSETEFESFWKEIKDLYKHFKFNAGSKQEAKKVYKRLKLNTDSHLEVIKQTEKHLANKRKILAAKQFAPNPKNVSGWLSNRCWEDELDILTINQAPQASPPLFRGTPPLQRKAVKEFGQ